MPTFKSNHNENRKKVCLMCFEKGGASCREIVEGGVVHQSINTYFIENLDPCNGRFPTGICSRCRKLLTQIKNGEKTSNDLFEPYNFSSIVIIKETRNTPDCQCKICAIARQKGTLSSSSQVIGRPKHESQAFPSPMPIKVCQMCYNVIGKGLSHVCNITERRKYLIAAINKGKDFLIQFFVLLFYTYIFFQL